MITLYGAAQTRSFRVLWALEEANLNYDYRQVEIGHKSEKGTQAENYRQLNFQGKVPCIIHDGIVMNESAAIINYIAQLKPEINLIPKDLKIRAYYDELCFFIMSDFEQALWTVTKHQKLIPKDLQVPDIRKVADWEFARSVSALQNYISNKEFAVGDNFTMADILISHTLRWAVAYQFEIPQNLNKYMNKMFERPAYKSALQKEQS